MSLLAACSLLAPGCEIRKAMYDQPKYEPYQKSEFFGDARSVRPLVEGTIPVGALNEDPHLYQGKVDGQLAATFPFAVTKDTLKRGQERFNIYCAPCHDAAGTGNGMVVQRGFKKPTPYTEQRLIDSPPGYFFDVITRGFGQMPSYAEVVKADDRWAIAAYIRVLQLSQHAKLEDVPESERSALESARPQAAPQAAH